MKKGKPTVIEGVITITLDTQTVRMQLEDKDAGLQIIELSMRPSDFVAALGRRAFVPCQMILRGLDKVGRVQEYRHWSFPLPEDVDYWTPEHTDAKYERPDIRVTSGLRGTLWSDRSFIRLQNVSLSYEWPKDLIQSIKLQRGRIYFNGQDLLTFTKWNGWDPEPTDEDGDAVSINRTGRPVLKSFTFGINVIYTKLV